MIIAIVILSVLLGLAMVPTLVFFNSTKLITECYVAIKKYGPDDFPAIKKEFGKDVADLVERLEEKIKK